MTDNFDAVKALCTLIDERYADFVKNSSKITNKAGARRARKNTIDLTILLKEYRKLSIK